MEKLLERMEGDRELIREVFAIFVEEAPGRRMKIEQALLAEDLEAMIMLSHALKGASSTLQAEPLRQACVGLENAARDGDADKVRGVVYSVLELLDKTANTMAELIPRI